MSYKIEIQNNFFVVTDTATGIEEIREVRDQVKWRVSGSIYSFFYNIANLVDQNSPNIIRLGENAKEFDFSEIVDSTETPFASRAIFNDLLNVNLGFMIRETSSVWGLITGDINDQTDLQTILNGKFDVPTGDTTQYIAGDGTLITFPIAGQAGTLVREVKNTTGATLTKGTIVYINGANGNKPTVAKALATSDATSAQTFGFLQTDIANNAVGYAVAMGDLIGLDTSGITEGTQLYLSSTVAGTYTTTKQIAPAHLVYVGIVTRSHPTLGQIEVKIQNGYELDELHDVLISGETDGQVLQFEGASGLWKNKTLATGLTVGTTAISSGTDGRVLFQNGGVLQQSANLTFGTGLKVLSNGVNDSFVINNSADSSTLFKVTKEGYFHSNYYWQFNRLNGTTLELYSLTTGFSFREGGAPFALLGLNESKFGNTNTNDSVLAIRTSTAYGGEYPLGSIIQGLGTNGSVILSPLSGASFKGMLGYYNGTSYASALEYNNTTSGGTVVKLVQNGSGAVSIGQSTNGARLDVKAQGALSTDSVFRIRNSANNADILKIAGNGNLSYNALGGGISLYNNDGTTDIGSTGGSVTRVNLLTNPAKIYVNYATNERMRFESIIGGTSGEIAYKLNASTGSINGYTYGAVINILDNRPDLGNRANTQIGLSIQRDATNVNTLLQFQALEIPKGRVSIGWTSSTYTGAKFDILAEGVLSTDIALRVRNSANTGDMLNVKGNGNVQVGVGGLSIPRTDSPSGTLVGTFTYQTSSIMRCDIPFEVSGTYGRTGFAPSQVALDLQYAQVNLRCFGGAGNTGFTFNTISATTGNHFMRIQNGSNDFLNVSSGGGFLFTNIASSSFAMPNASAKVQIDSTTQGFLPPRMTNAQRTAIASPAVGLMVYCTDAVEGLYIYKSTGWTFVI
jgi:hypothetical protein